MLYFEKSYINQTETIVHYCTYDCCVLAVLGRSCNCCMYCLTGTTKMHQKRSAIMWSIKAAVGVWEAIVQEQKGSHESDVGVITCCDSLLNIGHDLLMVKELELFLFLRSSRWSPPVSRFDFTAPSVKRCMMFYRKRKHICKYFFTYI